jgi:hypothetical protein
VTGLNAKVGKWIGMIGEQYVTGFWCSFSYVLLGIDGMDDQAPELQGIQGFVQELRQGGSQG